MKSVSKKKIATAWFLLTTALAVHVIDEAVNSFLPFYNDLVLSIRDSLGFSPMPTFAFPVWVGGLILLILVCYAITPVVGRAWGYYRIPVAIFAVIMIINGCGHIIGSKYFARLLPGFWSSFLLIAGGIYLIYSLYGRVRT
jgi:hypothetical protein